jgi:hypothetical protein
VVDEATFRIGRRVRIRSSGSTATILATFDLSPGYYAVKLDCTRVRQIVAKNDLEALDSPSDTLPSHPSN